MSSEAKPRDPASYALSVKRNCDTPLERWFATIDTEQHRKQMERVVILEAEDGLGHGHTGPLVAYWRARGG